MTSRLRAIHPFADERGQALVLALLVLTFLAVSLGTLMFFTAGNQRNGNYQKAAQVATSLAQAGVNNGVSVLANPANSCCLEVPWSSTSTAVLPDNSPSHLANTSTYNGNTVKWWGTLNTASETWTLHGQATVANPTGPSASPIVKSMSAQVLVNAPQPTNFQVGVWNTIYSPFGPTTGCDTSFGQGVTINVPLYVGGNLCMGQNSVALKPVYVGGYLFFQNKQSSIGSSSARVNSAHVGGYCQVQNSGTQVFPCKSESTNPSTNVWVTGSPTDLRGAASDFAGIAPPVICWAPGSCGGDPVGGWYSAASPGPLHPCTTSSGTPPTFDNDTTWGPSEGQPNGSLPTTVNLTPAASYTCKTGQGELSWNAVTKILTVAGTVFIDGSATMSGTVKYTGWGSNGQCTNSGDCQAVLYLSGSFSMTSSKLCAVLNSNGNDCDWNTWDPNKKILIIAANGAAGINITTTSSFQGGLYATDTISTGQQVTTEGPLVSGTQVVNLGQQAGGTFPPITILPLSIQEAPQGFYISPPYNYKYS